MQENKIEERMLAECLLKHKESQIRRLAWCNEVLMALLLGMGIAMLFVLTSCGPTHLDFSYTTGGAAKVQRFVDIAPETVEEKKEELTK